MRRTIGIAVPLLAVLAAGVAWGSKPSKRLSDEARGLQLYNRHCIQCHGASVAGDGPATEALVPEVPNLRGKMEADTPDREAERVLEGHDGMPGFSMSFDLYDARRVLRHMVRLSTREATAPEPTEPESPEIEEPNTDDAGE